MKSFDQSSLAQCDEPDTGATTAITAYQALIRTEDGAFRDEGLALSSVTQTPGRSSSTSSPGARPR